MSRRALGLWTVALLATALLIAQLMPLPMHAAAREKGDANLVRIDSVDMRMSSVGPVVLLKAQKRAVPVFVDVTVAQSIQSVLSGAKPPRPLSHDLMYAILDAFDGRVTRVVVMLKGETFYADLTVLVQGTSKNFDSRSSDAIALATHFKAPIYVPRTLLDKVGIALEEPQEAAPGGVRL
jgi:uncharacterized protein